MNYKEAVKETQSRKAKENYCVVHFDYNTKYVMPYKDGVALLNALTVVEQLSDSYSNQGRITEVDPNVFKLTLLSPEQYQRYKIAALLNVSVHDVEKYEKGELT